MKLRIEFANGTQINVPEWIRYRCLWNTAGMQTMTAVTAVNRPV